MKPKQWYVCNNPVHDAPRRWLGVVKDNPRCSTRGRGSNGCGSSDFITIEEKSNDIGEFTPEEVEQVRSSIFDTLKDKAEEVEDRRETHRDEFDLSYLLSDTLIDFWHEKLFEVLGWFLGVDITISGEIQKDLRIKARRAVEYLSRRFSIPTDPVSAYLFSLIGVITPAIIKKIFGGNKKEKAAKKEGAEKAEVAPIANH